MFEPDHLITYIPTFAWIAFNTAGLVLSILFFTRTKRKPFSLIFVSFLLLVIKDAYYVFIDGGYFTHTLVVELGMSALQASQISVFVIGIPSIAMSALASILLLIAVIQFYKESRTE